jgi:hypothetical protein
MAAGAGDESFRRQDVVDGEVDWWHDVEADGRRKLGRNPSLGRPVDVVAEFGRVGR